MILQEANKKISYTELESLYSASQVEIITLKERLSQLERLVFGSKHERFIPSVPTEQLSLELGIEQNISITAIPTEQITYKRQKPQPTEAISHPGRTSLPAELPRETVVLEPIADVSDCVVIGTEVTEVLEMTPSRVYVKRYERPKYAPKDKTKDGISIAAMPDIPFYKYQAGASTIAHIVIDKYAYHQPIYRQQQKLKEQSKIDIPYNTIESWAKAGIEKLEPLGVLLQEKIRRCSYLQADETPLKVIDKDKKGTTHRGYLWAYHDPVDGLMYFDYQEGRGKAAPTKILSEFKGYLQTDGYAVYEQFRMDKGVTLFHCWAHARRYFEKALDNNHAYASHALREIQKLYAIERTIKEQTLEQDEKVNYRQIHAMPILSTLRAWLQETYPTVLPKSSIGTAIEYTLSRWDRLCVYTTNAELHIDNNAIENKIRPIAIGRKNFLFAGSHKGAERIALIYSFMACCRMQELNPTEWLIDVYHKIDKYPKDKLHELLPNSPLYKKADI